MNLGSLLPLEIQSLTSPQDYLVPNKPRKVVSANHKSNVHNIKGFLEVGDFVGGWNHNGAGLSKKHTNQVTSYHMPIIHPNSKSLLELTKDLPNLNYISEKHLSPSIIGRNKSSGSRENINHFHTKDKSNNGSTTIGNNNHDVLANKSKVPDIQMINKYYGLIPKKFTVHSRQVEPNQRNSKHATTMSHATRSKSAHPSSGGTSSSGSRKKLGHLGQSKSFDISEEELHEPQLKVSLRLRRGNSLDLTQSLSDEAERGSKSLMAIGKNANGGLVAKKMSVEKQKRVKNKPSSLLLRSSSLSSMDDGRNCHAREKSMGDNCNVDGNTETQRVIKIDLNNMSWEESFQSCYSPFEEPGSTRESSPVSEKVYSSVVKGSANEMCPVLSSGSCNNSSGGDGWTTSVNSSESGSSIGGGGGSCGSPSSLFLPCDSLEESSMVVQNKSEADTHARIDYEDESLKERESVLNDWESSCGTPSTPVLLPILSGGGNDDNALRTTIDESSTNRPNGSATSTCTSSGNNNNLINEGEVVKEGPVGGESPSRMDGRNDSSSALESRRARMRKTISFDEQILRNKESNGGQNSSTKQDVETVRIRRPTTASTNKQANLPPQGLGPGKVVPWTQKSGRNLTLSERRSKFQKSVSIHSTAESLDYGEGEGSDCDTDFGPTKPTSPPAAFTPSPKSSAYRDTSRKPLFFQPAPEISTMISQISPIDNLEIQCEIEKVAIMLKNMQNQNKSFIDLTPAAAFISQDTHLTTNTRARNPTPLIKESDLLSPQTKLPSTVTVTKDINGNPTNNSNANIMNLPDGNKVATLQQVSSTNNGSDFSSVRSNISLEDKASSSTLANTNNKTSLGQLAPHETNGNNTQDICTTGSPGSPGQAKASSISDSTSTVLGSRTAKNENLSFGIKSNSEMRNGTGLTGNLHSPSNLKIPESHNVSAYGSSNTVTSPGMTKRPPLKKSVSISCEKELYKTPGDHENEANGNGNSSNKIENKSARPKTAVTLSSKYSPSSKASYCGKPEVISSHHNTQRARSLNSHVSTQNHNNRSASPSIKNSGRGSSSMLKPSTKEKENDKIENVINDYSNNGSNKNQASKNRKILIKKALIEITQSSSHFQKKWGILGRPKTAPSSNNNLNGHGEQKLNKKLGSAMNSSSNGSHKRQPLKASQPLLNGVKPGQVVGKQVIPGIPGEEEGEGSESDGKEEGGTMNKNATGPGNDHDPSRRSLQRQSFSLDEGLLLSFSNKEFGWKTQEQEEEAVTNKTETLVLNSKKREECLKVYNKMINTGLSVKLDTILRGMMTPSEYRVFIKAAENAAREAAIAKEEAELAASEAAAKDPGSAELHENEADAGVSEPIVVSS